MSKTTPYDKLATSRPINKLAAMQLSSGTHWQPNVKLNPHGRRWETPPTTKRLNGRAKTFVDLTGLVVGRFTVVGCLGKLNPKKKAVWLVRCACGNNETRGARYLKTGGNPNDMCEHCRYLERVKKGEGNTPVLRGE